MCIHRQFPYINTLCDRVCVKFKFCTADMRKLHKASATITLLQNGLEVNRGQLRLCLDMLGVVWELILRQEQNK